MRDREGAPTHARGHRAGRPPPRGNHGVPWSGAVIVAALCGGGAYWAGDSLGYQRGYGQARECAGDPLDRLDQQAVAHQGRLAAARSQVETRRETPARPAPSPVVTIPPVPDKFSFHETLKGGPGKAQDRMPVLTSAAPTRGAPAVSAATETVRAVPAPGLAAPPAPNDYTLQVGAFPDKNDALKLYDRLKALGYKPVISPSETAGSTWYRVRVGRFADRAGADQGAVSLNNGAHLGGIAVKH